MIEDGAIVAARFVADSAGQPTLSDAGRADQGQIVDPVSLGEPSEQGAIETSRGAVVEARAQCRAAGRFRASRRGTSHAYPNPLRWRRMLLWICQRGDGIRPTAAPAKDPGVSFSYGGGIIPELGGDFLRNQRQPIPDGFLCLFRNAHHPDHCAGAACGGVRWFEP